MNVAPRKTNNDNQYTNPHGGSRKWYAPESDGLKISSRKFRREWW
jgi:hypothetical protein